MPLYRAFKKYGLQNFEFKIIEECKKEKLNEREIYWIAYFNSFHNGYNLTPGGDGGSHYVKLSEQLVKNIIDDLSLTLLTGKDLAKKYNVNKDTISMINNGRLWRQDNTNYPIRPASKPLNYCIDCGALINRASCRCKACESKNRMKTRTVTITADELAKLLYETSFYAVGKKFNVTDNAVRKWCKHYNIPTHSKEFRAWYELNYSPDSITE